LAEAKTEDNRRAGVPPAFKVRDGEMKVAVWENTSEDGKIFYNAELEVRRFDKKTG
jgi:hypothetical protein